MLDLKIFYFFNYLAGKSAVFDASVIFFSDYFQYFLVAFFILFLFFSLREKTKLFLTALASVILSRLVITELIRFLYCRPRPFLANAVTQLVEENQCSFPSGHAAFFFALAMAVYFYNEKWGWSFFAAALVISIARIVAGVHYPLDIAGGAIIGVLSAYAVFNLIKKYEK